MIKIIKKEEYRRMSIQLKIDKARIERQEKVLRKYIQRNSDLYDLLKEAERRLEVVTEDCKFYKEEWLKLC